MKKLKKIIIFVNFFLFFIISPINLYSEPSLKVNYPTNYFPPVVGVSSIIHCYDDKGDFLGIVLIKRGKKPYGLALPAGKLEYIEDVKNDDHIVEVGLRREVKEETNLNIYDIKLNVVHSPIDEQFPFPLVEINFTSKSRGLPIAGDDAAEAYVVRIEDIPWDQLINRHRHILQQYFKL